MRQLFVDLDGVLSDFDGHYEKLFGVRPNQDTYEPPELWDNIRKAVTFFHDQPLMPRAMDLWYGCKALYPKPIILTGIPWSARNVEQQKQEWVWEHLGYDVKVICCRSVDKHKHGKPGDVLIDDRTKYMHHWTDMGGQFIIHNTVHETLAVLAALPR